MKYLLVSIVPFYNKQIEVNLNVYKYNLLPNIELSPRFYA